MNKFILLIGGYYAIYRLVIKRLVMALCMLYTVDLITSSAGFIIPINVVSVIFVSLLGIPALFGLAFLKHFM